MDNDELIVHCPIAQRTMTIEQGKIFGIVPAYTLSKNQHALFFTN